MAKIKIKRQGTRDKGQKNTPPPAPPVPELNPEALGLTDTGFPLDFSDQLNKLNSEMEAAKFHPYDNLSQLPGISVRDYIATQAMSGMLGRISFTPVEAETIAIASYQIADLMLIESKK